MSETGYALVLLFVAATVAVLVIFIAIYVGNHWSSSPKTVYRLKPAPIAEGNLNDTHSYEGKLFPNLSINYQLIHQSIDASNTPALDYLVNGTQSDIKNYVSQVCKNHHFQFQFAGNSNSTSCIDKYDSWKFDIYSVSELKTQPWYAQSESNGSVDIWLHIVSSGTPVYN